MNIEEYRAMVAAEAESTQEEAIDTQESHEAQETSETTPPPEEAHEEAASPTKINVDGEEIDLDTIRQMKTGNMLHADYTKKTQELAALRREAQSAIEFFNHVKSNPTLSQQLLDSDTAPIVQRLDPAIEQQERLRQENADLKVAQEIREMRDKYGDEFDPTAAMQMAVSKGLRNLDDAHQFVMLDKHRAAQHESQQASTVSTQQVVDVDALRAQLLKEIKDELVGTQSIITSSGSTPPATDEEVHLTDAQARIAKIYGMSPQEYLKWNNS